MTEAPASTTIEDLKAIRELIAKGWTQHVYAKNSRGIPIGAFHRDAVCFCLYGALKRVEHFKGVEDSYDASGLYRLIAKYADKRRKFVRSAGLVGFNDEPSTTQADVIALLDEIIHDQQAQAPVEPSR